MAYRKVNNMVEWTEREIGICLVSLIIGLCVGGLIGIFAEQPEIIEVYQDPDEK